MERADRARTAPGLDGAVAPDSAVNGSPSSRTLVTAGIVLIAVGVLLLAGRLWPDLAWWRFWPTILIAAGLVRSFTRGKHGRTVGRMFDGFVAVAVGSVLLLTTLGIVGLEVWGRILSFWPLALVALGLEILGKALRSSWPKVFGSMLIIAALAYSAAVSVTDLDDVSFLGAKGAGAVAYSGSEPVMTATDGRFRLEAGVARVRVGPGDELVRYEGSSLFGEPKLSVARPSPDRAEAELGLTPRTVMVLPGERLADYTVSLSRDVLWDVIIETSVAELDADLSGLRVSSVELKPGVASCEVRLGPPPAALTEGRVEVRAGVSSVRLRIPKGSEARVTIESGMSSNVVRGGFVEVGRGVWETAGYAEARASGRTVWVIDVTSGLGAITVETYEEGSR